MSNPFFSDKPDWTLTHTQLTGTWGPHNGTGGGFEVSWQTKSAGFGTATIYLKDGKLWCDNETLGRDFLKAVLSDLVDRCDLVDPE